MQQHGSNYFICRSPPTPHPMTLENWSISRNSTFSEHGHAVYQIKWNPFISNMVGNILPADLPSPYDPRGKGPKVKI